MNSQKLKHSLLCSATALGLSAVPLQSAVAQTTPSAATAQEETSGLQEIVVTAQKRSEGIQSTPVSITAVSGEQLAAKGVTNLQGVFESTPNVQFSQSTGNARIAVRGVGYDSTNTGGEGRVAYHVDGVYLSRPTAILGSFYDVARVEVLRGPQGTLYGRNATAGAINVITNDPTQDLSGYAQLSYGNYQRIEGQGAVSGALADGVEARLAFDVVHRDGYGKNLITGEDIDNESSQAVRGKLALKPTDNLRVTLSADFLREKDNSGEGHFFGNGGFTAAGVPVISVGLRQGGVPPSNPRDVATQLTPTLYRKIYGFGGQIDWSLGDFDVTSITAWRHTTYDAVSDLGGVSPPNVINAIFHQHEVAQQFSEEVRVSTKRSWGSIVIGGYYFHEHIDGDSAVPINSFSFGAPSPGILLQAYEAPGTIVTDALAAFGQVTFNLTEELKLDLGARYSTERKAIDEQFAYDLTRPYSPTNAFIPTRFNTDADRWNSFDPKVVLSYSPRRSLLLYASYSKGFKSGGFNLGGLQPPFNPEKITDYEVGIKADWLDRRLRTNISGFWYDYKDLQASIINATVVQVVNAAKARVRGVEAEITALPIPELELQANVAYLDGRYTSFCTADPARPNLSTSTCSYNGATFPGIDLNGNPMTQAPKWTTSFAATYTVAMPAGDLRLRGEVNTISKVYYSPFKRDEVAQPGYALINASVTYRTNSGVTLTAYARNLTNEFYRVSTSVSSASVGSPITALVGAPRTYGLSARYDF